MERVEIERLENEAIALFQNDRNEIFLDKYNKKAQKL